MTVPSVLFGAIAKATKWEETEWGSAPKGTDTKLVLPLCLQYLTPSECNPVGYPKIQKTYFHSTFVSFSCGCFLWSGSHFRSRHVFHRLFYVVGKHNAGQECLQNCFQTQGKQALDCFKMTTFQGFLILNILF